MKIILRFCVFTMLIAICSTAFAQVTKKCSPTTGGKITETTDGKYKATANSGYQFSKWKIEGETTGSRTSTTNPIDITGDVLAEQMYGGGGSVTLTAYFTQVTMYTITWKNWDNSVFKTTSVAKGSTPSYTGATPTRASTAQYTYTFKGWTPTIVAATANATYTATYTQTLRQYTITWKNADGTTLKTEQVAYGATPSYTGTTPTKPATAEYTYTFAGWTPEVVAVTGEATYTATYIATKNSYTITWKQDDGTTIDETTVEYGEVPTHADPTKPATAEYTYTFAGWTPEVVSVTGEATYTATYTATKNSYTITWKQDDGTTIDETTVEYYEVPTHAEPTKTATAEYTYTFSGWSPEVVAVTGDATYTAIYSATKNSYTITWKQDDGTTIDETTVEYGEVPTHEDPTKDATAEYTYTFAGWSPEVVSVTGEATYTATYTATKNSYTITWKQDDGTTIDQTTVEYGEVPTHADPTKPATVEYTYTFAGWSPEVVAVTGEATYTATYTATKNSYTITWKQDDGTTIDETTVEYGEVPTHADPTKPATAEYTYTFSGWSPEVVSVTGEATYTATYTATKNSYTITWKQDDGTTIDQTTVEYGEVPTHADPTKPATAEYTYTFAGWSPEVTAVTGEATYTATYSATKNSYTITWKQDDGTTIDQTTVEYGEVPTHEDPTKEATVEFTYTFAGWSPEVVAVAGEATYTATYTATKNSYTITWKQDDGTTIDETTVEYGEVPTHADPTKPATAEYTYTFAGWSPEVEAVTGDATYTATYTATKNSYTITWKQDDGTTIDETTVEYGEVPTHEDPTKPATAEYTYTFAGWTPEIAAVTEDATYTATYDSTVIVTYQITWKNYDGTILKIDTVQEGITPEYVGETPSKPETAQYSYIFYRWSPTIEVASRDITYKAQYKQITKIYAVTFQNYDGSEIYIDSIEAGNVAHYEGVLPTMPNTDQYHYYFVGWSPDLAAVYEDVKYIAMYDSISIQCNSVSVNYYNADDLLQSKNVNLCEPANFEYDGNTPISCDKTSTYFEGWTNDQYTKQQSVTNPTICSFSKSESYTINSKYWETSDSLWLPLKSGFGYIEDRGLQITGGMTAMAVSKRYYSNISSVQVVYCTNSTSGMALLQ